MHRPIVGRLTLNKCRLCRICARLTEEVQNADLFSYGYLGTASAEWPTNTTETWKDVVAEFSLV